VVEYLKGAMALDEKDRVKALQYCFRHLDSADPDVAFDAFLEFAKAGDQDVGKVAPTLDPAKLRKLLTDPQTPADRLGVFAFLLGACGKPEDADLLAGMFRKGDDRTRAALSGLLGGYIQLRPDDGWGEVRSLLGQADRPLGECLAALGTLRFYHGWKPED